jgi:hypothetical protein
MRTLLLAVVLATGCGSAPAPYTYSAGCLRGIESELPLIQTALDSNAAMAQRLVLEVGAVASEADYCEAFGDLRIVVRDSDYLHVGAGIASGVYSLFTGIETQKDMSALVHELLHAASTTHCQPGNAWHEHWDVNGYDNADRTFGFRMTRVRAQNVVAAAYGGEH